MNRLENYLITRNTELELKQRKRLVDRLTLLDSQSALIELTLRLKKANDSESKDYFEERLSKLDMLINDHITLTTEYELLEVSYRILHHEYSKLVDTINNLKKDFETE